MTLPASLNILEVFELSVVGAEFLLVVVNPVSPIISQLQPPSRHSDISWSHHGDESLRRGRWTLWGRKLSGVEVGDLPDQLVQVVHVVPVNAMMT